MDPLQASTIGEVLARRAAAAPEAVALIGAASGPVTFASLARHIAVIKKQLADTGLGPGNRVGLALPRSPEAALLSVSVCCAATLVPINPHLSPADLSAEIERLRLDALIVRDKDVPWAAADLESGLFVCSTAGDGLALAAVRRVTRRRHVADRASWAAIFKTSGTTGTSKRVPVTHENLIEMARKMERWLTLSPQDRSACLMPIYYNAGFKATLLAPLMIGCSVALPATTDPQAIERWLDDLAPTWLTASPAFLQALADRLRDRTDRLPHHLRFVLSTASYLPAATGKEVQRLLGVPVAEFYGLCEAGIMTAPSLSQGEQPPGSVGRIPNGELVIRPHDGAAGEVMLRGPSVMPGYLLDDIDNEPTGLVDGWLATGDLGEVDRDGFLRVIGRSKEIINRGGEKVSPYDVEKVLLGHPAVRQAAAFALPHRRLGETVGAAAVLHEGASADSRELVDFLYDRLAPFQMPRHVHLLDELPTGATGKISRPRLSQMLAERREIGERPAAPLEILIVDLWRRLLDREDIGLDDDFFDLGGDSLQATEMLIDLEGATRHPIAPSDVGAQLTIRGLAATLTGAVAARREVLTRVRDGTGTPLFLCHGDFLGWGFYGFRLAELIDAPGPVYLLHSLLDPAQGIESIEQMADRHLPALLAAAPLGPVRLAGYCHGGLAAMELARRLEKSGRPVERLVLIDTFSINARPVMRALLRLASLAGAVAPGNLGRRIRRSLMPSLWVLARHILARDPTILRRTARTLRSGTMRAWDASQRTAYYRAMAKYLPHRLQTNIVCLLCEEYARRQEYAAEPWRRLAGKMQSSNIPGEHNTCVSRHLNELAQSLNRVFAGA